MRIYAAIDTNVLVAALLTKNSDAATLQVLQNVLYGKIIPLCSRLTLAEYGEVLRRPKFHQDEKTVANLIATFNSLGYLIEPRPCVAILPDPKDIPFWEIVLSYPGSYLVTGNKKHFPAEPCVLSPAELLALID